MATYIAGPTGAGLQDGSDWENRLAGFNAVEDLPIAAGDLAWFGPGVYRESHTVDVSGGAGTEIIYQGDVTGEHTDGVGGVVRITASDNDQTPARNQGVWIDGKDYRIFRGFRLDMADTHAVQIYAGDHITFEDCVIVDNDDYGIFTWFGMTDLIVRRCGFFLNGAGHVGCGNGTTLDDVNHLIQNCLFLGQNTWSANIYIQRVGGITVRNCSFLGSYAGIHVAQALTIGQSETVENCIFDGCNVALTATAVGEIVEDFNAFDHNGTDRTNTNTGGNSNTHPSLITMPLLHSGASQISGFQFPWWLGGLSEWSQIRAITGSNEPTVDLLGIVRPTTAAKNSWGAVQFHDAERETSTTYSSSAASVKLTDAGSVQLGPFEVPNLSITISVQVQREANYAGTNPRLVIKQPGAADDTTTDAAAVSQWNELTTTLTPNADPSYVYVELQSLNTAAAGNYDTFFDHLVVNGKVIDFDEWVTDRIILRDHELTGRRPRIRVHGA